MATLPVWKQAICPKRKPVALDDDLHLLAYKPLRTFNGLQVRYIWIHKNIEKKIHLTDEQTNEKYKVILAFLTYFNISILSVEHLDWFHIYVCIYSNCIISNILAVSVCIKLCSFLILTLEDFHFVKVMLPLITSTFFHLLFQQFIVALFWFYI